MVFRVRSDRVRQYRIRFLELPEAINEFAYPLLH